MERNCPSRFLRREIAVLRPGVMILFGNPPWTAVDALADELTESVSGADFARGVARIDDLTFELFWMYHPAHMNMWERSFPLLLAELLARPVRDFAG